MSDKEMEALDEVADNETPESVIAAPPADESPQASAPPEPSAPTMVAPAPAMSPVPPPGPQEAAPNEAVTPAPAPAGEAAPEASPDNPQPPANAQAPMTLSAEQRAAESTAKNAAFFQDLTAGHIQPKTYHDLYESKGTLGKIGTIFGLILGGAGSGLTHQPNVLLDMMNKEIERDVEKQKTNASNKQNWYKAALEHERLQPDIIAGYAKADSDIEKAKMDAYVNAKAGVNALNMSSAAMLHRNQSVIDMMAPGPKKDAAQWTQDNVVLTDFLNRASKRNLAVEKQKDLLDATSPPARPKGNPPPGQKPVATGARFDAYNKNALAKMNSDSNLFGDKAGRVGVIPKEEREKIDAEIPKLEANRNTYADTVDRFHKLAAMPMAGQAPGVSGLAKLAGAAASLIPGHHASAGGLGDSLEKTFTKERDTQMQGLIGQLAQGNISVTEATRLAEAFMPSYNDTPRQREEKFQQLKNHFTSQAQESTPVMERWRIKYPAPNYVFKDPRNKETLVPEGRISPAKLGENKQ